MKGTGLPDRLFRSRGDGTFEDVTDAAGTGDRGFSHGVAVGDYDDDGFDDVLITNVGRKALYHNQGDGTFRECAEAAGLGARSLWSTSAAWADLDQDGYLDVYIANYVKYDPYHPVPCVKSDGSPGVCHPREVLGEIDECFFNNGDGTFTLAGPETGLHDAGGKGLGVVVADFNNDGRSDIFVANDITDNFLFINQGQRVFVESALPLGCAVNGEGYCQASMGIGLGDYDRNGWLDLYVGHFTKDYATLFANSGRGGFQDVSRAVGSSRLTANVLTFGVAWEDFNQDGYDDFFLANGHIDDWRFQGEEWEMNPQLFTFDGQQLQDGSQQAGDYFRHKYLGRTVVQGDYDDDGDFDLLVVHQNKPTALLRNDSVRGHWLKLQFHGRRQQSAGHQYPRRIDPRDPASGEGTGRRHRLLRDPSAGPDFRVGRGPGPLSAADPLATRRRPGGPGRAGRPDPGVDRAGAVESGAEEVRGLSMSLLWNRKFWWLTLVLACAGLATWIGLLPGNRGRSPKHVPPPRPSQPSSGPAAERWTRPAPPEEEFVGSQRCVECHREVYDAYQSHPMARSLTAVGSAAPIEDLRQEKPIALWGRVHYRVEQQPAAVLHHEVRTDKQGQLLYDQAVPIHYAVGSGARPFVPDRPRRSVVPIPDFLVHAEETLGPFARLQSRKSCPVWSRIGDSCLACHAGRLQSDGAQRDRYQQPPFAEPAIGCERCHGPGGRHVQWRTAAEQPPEPDPLVRLAKLTPRQRESVCDQCHLQGEERFLRYGRTDLDFRPGDSLDDAWTVFVRRLQDPAQLVSPGACHVEQLRSSVCYQRSPAGLGCSECHDPHRVPAGEHKAEFYRQRCLQCHQERGCSLSLQQRQRAPANDSCIHCHMVKLTANDLPHLPATDHRILRFPAGEAPRPEVVSLVLFDDAEDRLSPLAVERVRGFLLAKRAEARHDDVSAHEAERLLGPVLNAAPDDVEALHWLAVACWTQNRFTAAAEYWQRILKIEAEHEGALQRLAKLFQDLSDDIPQARQFVERSLARDPWQATFSRTPGTPPRQARTIGRGNSSGPAGLGSRPLADHDLRLALGGVRTPGPSRGSRSLSPTADQVHRTVRVW